MKRKNKSFRNFYLETFIVWAVSILQSYAISHQTFLTQKPLGERHAESSEQETREKLKSDVAECEKIAAALQEEQGLKTEGGKGREPAEKTDREQQAQGFGDELVFFRQEQNSPQ